MVGGELPHGEAKQSLACGGEDHIFKYCSDLEAWGLISYGSSGFWIVTTKNAIVNCVTYRIGDIKMRRKRSLMGHFKL